ncbi:MAG: hypothetical protein HY366_00320, partial [Candidatus Aenigmarchaeota archaeon]|nr:hypothetical protein [Candidatus Aenigmarchaeota archaeon]
AIENTGRKDVALKEIVYSNTSAQIREVAVATRKSDSTLVTAANPLTPGSLISIHNTTVGYRPQRIVVTTNCPGVIAGVENDTTTNKFKKVFS